MEWITRLFCTRNEDPNFIYCGVPGYSRRFLQDYGIVSID